jgi:hypothetical protein
LVPFFTKGCLSVARDEDLFFHINEWLPWIDTGRS